jgi:hypothetical protein
MVTNIVVQRTGLISKSGFLILDVFLSQVRSMREPFILTNTVVTTWPALTKWPQSRYLSNHPSLQRMLEVERSKQKTFIFMDNKTQLASLNIHGIPQRATYDSLVMNASEFFGHIEDPQDSKF